jgi:hypothetical protein
VKFKNKKLKGIFMSNCNYAHLYWGFPLLDKNEEPLEFLPEGQDDDEFIAALFGVQKPTVPYEGNEAVFQAYWKNRDDKIRGVGIEFGYHDIDVKTHVPILMISEASHQGSSRDNPTSLPPSLEVKSEWKEKLREFCRKANLPFQEPHWVLAVSWDH